MKLKITQLEIDADAETLSRALPILARIAQGSTLELPPDVDRPTALPAPVKQEPSPSTPAACCGEPLPPKPKRKYKRQKPKESPPDKPRAAREPEEAAGPLRVNTGRSKERETLDALRKNGPCGASRLAALVGGGVSSTAMYQRLLVLMARGVIRKGVERGTFEVIDE